jgi:Glycosyltransferase family 87
MSRREPIREKFRANLVSIVHFLLWAVLVYRVITLLMPALDDPSFGIFFHEGKNGEVLRILDFPFHFDFAQKVWRHQTTVNSGQSVYSIENHLKVTSDWAGTRVCHSLHFGYSPTMLWVLAPLVPFSHAIAYLIFNIAGLIAVFWITRPTRCRWGIGLLSFFSATSMRCFQLGQTALLTGMGLLFMAEKTRDNRAQSWRDASITGAALWALTAKPPIALSAATVLLGLRSWRTLIVAGILTVFSTLIISPLLGAHWMRDYIHLLGAYNKVDAGPIFAWSIVPSIMVNLRAVLNVDIGLRDNVASNVSAIVWLGALACIVVAGLRSRVSAAALWSMGILSYLLFCPHVSTTEELQLVVILALSVSLRKELDWSELMLLVILPLLVFVIPLPGPFRDFRLPLFIVQFALFVFFAFSGQKFAAAGPDREEPACSQCAE